MATELIFALGLGAQAVGVDTSSTIPLEVKTLPQLGYVRKIPTEGILSLRPSWVIATRDLGPPLVIEQLNSAECPLLLLDATLTMEGARRRIQTLAIALRREEASEAILAHLDKRATRCSS